MRVCAVAVILLWISGLGFSQTVYTSEKEKKYHRKDCKAAVSGKTEMERTVALKKGYTSCKVCKPDWKEQGKPTVYKMKVRKKREAIKKDSVYLLKAIEYQY